MEISRHWRIRKQRLQMIGEQCPHCEVKIFPPRDICPRCNRGTLEKNINVQIGSPDPDWPSKLIPLEVRG